MSVGRLRDGSIVPAPFAGRSSWPDRKVYRDMDGVDRVALVASARTDLTRNFGSIYNLLVWMGPEKGWVELSNVPSGNGAGEAW